MQDVALVIFGVIEKEIEPDDEKRDQRKSQRKTLRDLLRRQACLSSHFGVCCLSVGPGYLS